MTQKNKLSESNSSSFSLLVSNADPINEMIEIVRQAQMKLHRQRLRILKMSPKRRMLIRLAAFRGSRLPYIVLTKEEYEAWWSMLKWYQKLGQLTVNAGLIYCETLKY